MDRFATMGAEDAMKVERFLISLQALGLSRDERYEYVEEMLRRLQVQDLDSTLEELNYKAATRPM